MRCLQPMPLAALQMAALQTKNDALKDRLQDLADLLDSHPDDYYLGLDAGSSDKDDDVEAAADADNVESDEADETYLRQLEEAHSSDETMMWRPPRMPTTWTRPTRGLSPPDGRGVRIDL